ncbi:aminotransferase class V-fold PLP-dependent enzyme [Serratia rubidaea]|nr:aminotransferase class V-fold PLP-dependent enzyme [Serratia rubidaea]
MFESFEEIEVCNEISELLFPGQTERTKAIEFIINTVDNYAKNISKIDVNPSMSKADIDHAMSRYDFECSLPADIVLSDVRGMLEGGIVHVTSPNYFGLFNPSTSFWGSVADFMAGLYNPQLAVWSHAPACVDIEEKLIGYFGQLSGFKEGVSGGSFTTGGTEANCTALVCALTQKVQGFAKHGIYMQAKRPIFYISADSHLAWLKIALQCGLGHDAVRIVEVDNTGKMNVERLNSMLQQDLQDGCAPFMLVGTAGTTNAGTIDPLIELAAVAKEYNLYFHIDAAWAGAVLLSEKYAPLLTGISQADSITLDAHKWLNVPMGTGMFICADKKILKSPFTVTTNYMPASDSVNADPYLHSVQWSRRFNGLKLFMPLAILGRSGFSQLIDYQVELGCYLKYLLEKNDWVIVNKTELPVICFRDILDCNVDLVIENVLDSGKVWLSSTTFDHKKAFRACITSFRSTKENVDNLVNTLNRARKNVSTRHKPQTDAWL